MAKIEAERLRLGLSVYALSKKAGIARSTYNTILKRGNEPKWFVLRKVCRALSLDMQTLEVIDFSKYDEVWLPPQGNQPLADLWDWLCQEHSDYQDLEWIDELEGLTSVMQKLQDIRKQYGL